MSAPHRFPNKRLSSILPGRPLKIREGLYNQLRDREWIFNRAENNSIFLIHKNGFYGVVVRIEEIDWNQLSPELSSRGKKESLDNSNNLSLFNNEK